jgi:hypothetical protein
MVAILRYKHKQVLLLFSFSIITTKKAKKDSMYTVDLLQHKVAQYTALKQIIVCFPKPFNSSQLLMQSFWNKY